MLFYSFHKIYADSYRQLTQLFQGAEQVNNIVSDGLRNRLFPHRNSSMFGGDLAVRNIMVSVKLQLLLMWFEMVQ